MCKLYAPIVAVGAFWSRERRALVALVDTGAHLRRQIDTYRPETAGRVLQSAANQLLSIVLWGRVDDDDDDHH